MQQLNACIINQDLPQDINEKFLQIENRTELGRILLHLMVQIASGGMRYVVIFPLYRSIVQKLTGKYAI